MPRIAGHCPNVQATLQIVQCDRININDSDVVFLGGQAFGNGCADLPRTQNYYFFHNAIAMISVHLRLYWMHKLWDAAPENQPR